MGSQITATYAASQSAWKVELPEHGPGKATPYIPYWVTHRLAHALGPDFNVLDQGTHLAVTSRHFRGPDADPHSARIERALAALIDGIDHVDLAVQAP